MKRYLISAALLIVAAGPAAAMNVQVFLTKAEALKRKGPLALFSSDLKLLMNQVESDMKAIKVENDAAIAAKRPTEFCAPPKGTPVSDKDILQAMYDVPAAKRATTDSKQALKKSFIKRYPCPR